MPEDAVKPDQWRVFFHSLSVAESISTACRKSKISRATVYWSKKHVVWVSERWEEALAAGVDYLKDAALERAVDGVTSTRHQYTPGGKLIATQVETKYSDRLLLALLASRDPTFRNNSSDQVQTRLTQELTRMLDLLQRKLAPEIYEQVVAVIAAGDNVINANAFSENSPIALEDNSSNEETDD